MNNELKMLMLSVMMTIVTIDRVDWLWKIYGHWAIRAITDQKNYVTNPMSGNAFLQEISMKDKDKLKWFSKVNINLANSIGDEEMITWWYIWVRFPRTGKMVKMWHFFIFFEALLWPNGSIFSTFVNCSEEILSVRC